MTWRLSDFPRIISLGSTNSLLASRYKSYFVFSTYRAVNSENDKVNNVKNQLTGEYGAVPDTARDYKVNY